MIANRKKPFRAEDREQFVRDFATSFMAGYCLKIYDECCGSQDYQRLYNPQIEDATHIAENVWEMMVEIGEAESA